MEAKNIISLVEMKMGQSGMVVDIVGGGHATEKLQALGIRIGKKITKQSAMLMRGPLTIRVDNAVVGLGYGIASKVMVDVKEGK